MYFGSLSSRLQGQRVFANRGFRRIAEWRNHGLSVIPIAELIRVMAASRLPALSASNHHERIVPVTNACHHSHRGPVMPRRRPRAEAGPALWLSSDAEYFFQPAHTANRMQNLQGIKSLPRPIFHARAPAVFFQALHGFIRCRHE